MTAVSYVSQKQMEKQTGFRKALGYAFPKEDKILIREDLPKDVEVKVKQHEEEHILKGEEGPFWGLIAGATASVIGGALSSSGDKDAAETAAEGSEREIQFLEESRDMARGDQAPYREAGYTALDALMSMTGLGGGRGGGTATAPPQQNVGGVRGDNYLGGLGGGSGYANYSGTGRYRARARALPRNEGGPIYGRQYGGYVGDNRQVPPSPYSGPNRAVGWGGPQQVNYNVNETGPENVYQGGAVTRNGNPQTIAPSGDGYVAPRENPGGVEGGYNFMTDPGYNFRIGEGQRTLERGAAAAGGLLSGGFARRHTRYAQDFASNEYTNVYNRISNIAGLGQVSAGQSGQAALYAGQNIGGAAAQGAYASAYGQQASGNAWANAANEIGQLPWDEVFNRNGGGGVGGNPTPRV